MPRPLCLALLLLGLPADSQAEGPAAGSAEAISLQVRIVYVPASLHDPLREVFGLDGKKNLVCDEPSLNALLESVQGHREGQVTAVPPVRAALNQTSTVAVNGFRFTVSPSITEGTGSPVKLAFRVVDARPGTTGKAPHPNVAERNTTLTPGRSLLLPGWWQEGKPGQEPQRVIVCVTLAGGR